MSRFGYHFIVIICLSLVSGGAASALELNSENAILIDYDTGDVLYEKGADDIVPPSSMTKIMTAYVIFDMLNAGIFSLNTKFKVSIRAWRQDGSRMFLEPEWKISVDDLLRGTIAISGNDSAVVLAEGSMGTISNFVDRMNGTARTLGMVNTHFDNPIGSYEKTHYMSVRDLATLSRALIENHSDYYSKYFAEQSFIFNNIVQKNKNPLLGVYSGVDGIKTGHTDQGKYSLALSALRNGKRLIAVIAKAESVTARTEDAKAILDYGFRQYDYIDLFREGDVLGTIDVFLLKKHRVTIYTNRDISYGVSKTRTNDVKVFIVYNKYVFKPVNKNETIAQLVIEDGNMVSKYDLYAQNDSGKLGKFRMFFSILRYNFMKLFSLFRHENSKILEQQKTISL
ncbi:MAG: D-alanyl-D-alanine carboxypeptidase [Rickettsiales bacterium]|jgi:D-alanyl-D-alanine carboxypeptidase (penicillin-binding protein 5/6)|nr:D-alanyl-D-alanine carboxypeptidase [Rickettsiales bacterium]